MNNSEKTQKKKVEKGKLIGNIIKLVTDIFNLVIAIINIIDKIMN